MAEFPPSVEALSTEMQPQDTIHSILKSAARFFSGTMLSRITGMFRDVALAFAFGTNEALAALFVAFRLSHVLRRFFGEGALQSAFVPLFEELRTKSEKKAFSFFRDLQVLWILSLSLLVGIGAFCLWSYLKLAQGTPSTNELLLLILIMLPSLLPICLFGLNTSLLQCHKRFFAIGVAPSIFNVTLSVSALLLKGQETEQAMPFLAFAIVVGCSLQWLFTMVPTVHIAKSYFMDGWTKGLNIFSSEIRRLWKPLSLGMLGIGASQINNAMDALFARFADPEGPAQLWFSLRLQQLPLALFGIALSSAILPPLSRAVQAEKKNEFLSFLDFAIRKTTALLAPCTAYLLVLGYLIVHCIYARGDFQAHSVLSTTACLHGYTLGLIPMGLVVIFAPAFFAKKNYSIPAKAALFSLLMNGLFDSIFVFGLGMKAVSVAAATCLSSCLNAAYLSYHLKKTWGSILSHSSFMCCIKIGLCSVGAFMITFFFLGMTTGYPLLFSAFPESCASLPESMYGRIYQLAIASFIFLGSLLGLAQLFKVEDLFLSQLWSRQKPIIPEKPVQNDERTSQTIS